MISTAVATRSDWSTSSKKLCMFDNIDGMHPPIFIGLFDPISYCQFALIAQLEYVRWFQSRVMRTSFRKSNIDCLMSFRSWELRSEANSQFIKRSISRGNKGSVAARTEATANLILPSESHVSSCRNRGGIFPSNTFKIAFSFSAFRTNITNWFSASILLLSSGAIAGVAFGTESERNRLLSFAVRKASVVY